MTVVTFDDARLTVTDTGSGVFSIECRSAPGMAGQNLAAVVSTAVDTIFAHPEAGTITWSAQAGDYDAWRAAWSSGFTFECTSRCSFAGDERLSDGWQASLLRGDSREPKTTWLYPARLECPGLVLRDLIVEDAPRYLETTLDPESMRWLATIALSRTPGEFARMFLDRRLPATLGRSISWTVADAESDAYLASISLFGLDGLDYKSAEVGYRTHPDARGRGILSAALRRMAEFAFAAADDGGLGLQRLSLGAGAGNAASQAVAESCGFHLRRARPALLRPTRRHRRRPAEIRPAAPLANSGRGVANSRRGVANSRRGVANSRRGVANSRRGVANSRRGVANSRRGVANSRRGGRKLPARGRKLPARGRKLPARGRELPARGRELPARGRELPARGRELPARGRELPARGRKLPARGRKLPARGRELPARGRGGATSGQSRASTSRNRNRQACRAAASRSPSPATMTPAVPLPWVTLTSTRCRSPSIRKTE